MIYLIGGVFYLAAMAFYFALMAIFWAIALTVTIVSSLVIAAIDYFTDEEPPKPVYSKYYKQFEVKK